VYFNTKHKILKFLLLFEILWGPLEKKNVSWLKSEGVAILKYFLTESSVT